MNKPVLMRLIIIISSTVIATGGVLGYQFMKPQTLMTNVQNLNTETADWKTYANTQQGFKLNYPLDWKTYNSGSMYSNSTIKEVSFRGKEGYVMVAYGTGSGNDFNSFCGQSYEKLQLGNKQLDACHNVAKDGSEAWSSRGKDFENYGIAVIVYVNNPYLLNRDKILQILSTFKFTDSQSQTADWKTYTSPDYSFSINYPTHYFGKIDTTREAYNDLVYGNGTSLLQSNNQNAIGGAGISIVYFPINIEASFQKRKDIIAPNTGIYNLMPIAVDGVKAYIFDGGGVSTGGAWIFHEADIPVSSGLISINIGKDGKDTDNLEFTKTENDIFNQMLSTFKFTK